MQNWGYINVDKLETKIPVQEAHQDPARNEHLQRQIYA